MEKAMRTPKALLVSMPCAKFEVLYISRLFTRVRPCMHVEACYAELSARRNYTTTNAWVMASPSGFNSLYCT